MSEILVIGEAMVDLHITPSAPSPFQHQTSVGPCSISTCLITPWPTLLARHCLSFDHAPTTSVFVVKVGAQGVRVRHGATTHHISAPTVQMISTTGAAVAFAAGFRTAWSHDPADLQAALSSGTKCSHVARSRVAAWPPAQVSEE